MPPRTTIRAAAVIAASAVALIACGSDSDSDTGDAVDGRPTVVVTTNILGDVVDSVLGGLADVQVVMPVGAEPHDFPPSARQAEAVETADLLVTNGAAFEAGMVGIIENVADSGTPVFAFADEVEIVDGDPHFWTDPSLIGAVLYSQYLVSDPAANAFGWTVRNAVRTGSRFGLSARILSWQFMHVAAGGTALLVIAWIAAAFSRRAGSVPINAPASTQPAPLPSRRRRRRRHSVHRIA